MRIVVATDSFKGVLTAAEVGEALAVGLRRGLADVEVDVVPVADGGDGTVQALVDATGGELREAEVTDPLGRRVTARWGLLGGEGGDAPPTAAIEMATASGLTLVGEDERDPVGATTYGTGELIRAAVDAGCRRLILGIGGSATTDGGAGMAQALGARLLDGEGREIGRGGGALAELERIDLSRLTLDPEGVEVVVACDVDNPLTGEEGAAHVYGPQKGADAEQVRLLDRNLAHLAEVIRRDLGVDVERLPGAGAAGGLGAGLRAFLGARLERGVDLVLDAVGLDERLAGADLVITGEGQLDAQTRHDKTPWGVARRAGARGVPVVAVAGAVADDAFELQRRSARGIGGPAQPGSEGAGRDAVGFDAVLGLPPRPMGLEEALERSTDLLRQAGETLGRVLAVGAGR